MKTILVTGAAGYVGNILCRDLLNKGYNVRAVDNFYKGYHDSLIPLAANSNFEFMYGDIRNPDDCKNFCSDVDGVIHLAAVVGFPACKKSPIDSESINIDGTCNILNMTDGKPFVFASTGSVYGKIEGICTENSSLNPKSLYGQHKLEIENIVRKMDNTVSLRFATGMGVSPNPRVNILVNDLTYQACSSGALTIFQPEAKRTFIHIEDMSTSMILALEKLNNNSLSYNVYNVGANELNLTKRELVDKIQSKTNCVVSYKEFNKDPDERDYKVDYSRWESEGFKHTKSIDETIDELIRAVPMMKVLNYQ